MDLRGQESAGPEECKAFHFPQGDGVIGKMKRLWGS
jgi:hypothetical protein